MKNRIEVSAKVIITFVDLTNVEEVTDEHKCIAALEAEQVMNKIGFIGTEAGRIVVRVHIEGVDMNGDNN